jgi:superfamily II DNA or RNA helicase/HKD family nuclease
VAPREDLPPGLYELLVTHDLRTRLEPMTGSASAHERALDVAEAPDRIALHVAGEVERALASVPESRRLRVAVETARAVIDRLEALAPSGVDSRPVREGRVLRAILRRLPDGTPEHLDAPLIPVLDTTLLTNAPGEPSLLRQLQSEIDTADAIDVVMAFIRRSGVAPLLEPLRRHCARGRPFRVLTTTYTGSTEAAALDRLVEAGAEVRVSYDSSTTRLHAKSWIFHRPTGFSTAYVGSSNLTHSAQAAGVEWNVRLSGARNRIVLDKVSAVFEGYWESGEFTAYDPGEFAEHVANTRRNGPNMLSPVEVRPYPFQSRLLERLTLARLRGHHRNLLVAATGTGKTVMAALDYAALRRAHPRLLFVAHRREILDQSQATFRHVLRDPSFGERWDGGHRPSRFEHVFASIQTLANADLAGLDPSRFDVVIVDEFHHAAAASYDALLSHVRPGELLGLTATPERSDGIDVLHHFEGRIAAELRLWDAIDQQHLSPFLYRGIADGTDLRLIPWRSGRGYDVDGLERLYTSDDAWARLVVKNVLEHAAPDTMRCLGFCVSVDHARFMARHFVAHGISAVAVSADSRPDERRAALSDLASGAIRVVFSVDLFNEGVDLPEVDTLLLLRPTDSPVLFIQQLDAGCGGATGRGTAPSSTSWATTAASSASIGGSGPSSGERGPR